MQAKGTIRHGVSRRAALKGAGALTLASGIGGFPHIAKAAGKVIRVGMNTILSGRVALVGTSSSNAARLVIDKFNAEGGAGGRTIELVVRDSKGRPDEAARVVRDLMDVEGCEIILDSEASSGAFAVHEVMRTRGVLCIHTNSETSQLTADPKMHIPTVFRSARQGIQDAVGGGQYAAAIAKKKKLTRWMTCSPDYVYGRDNTAQFMEYAKIFDPAIRLVEGAWPKLFQPDYTPVITKILQEKPQALYSALWGGDLSAFIDQGNLYGLFHNIDTFAVNLGDYSVLKAVKSLPKGLHSGSRYNRIVPHSAANEAFYTAYTKRFPGQLPTNWSWQNATGAAFMCDALKKTGGKTDGKLLAAAIAGRTIKSPFGVKGTITMRAEDHTIIDYAVAYGITEPVDPYLTDIQMADWGAILEHEAEWKKKKGYA